MADKKVHEADEQKKIRVTITSRDVKSLEGFTSEMIKMGNDHGQDVRIKGPVRMPTKHLKMTVRKSPCGEGSKTWDRYEMRIHKRVLDFECTLKTFKEVTNMKIPSGIQIEVEVE